MTTANVLQELEWRGFVQQATPGLTAHFAKGPVTAYCGFDPTAPSLQLGNLMPLMLLANLQRGGNRPIVLMGGGTGLIGDPSGKAGERPLLSKEQIRENLQRQRDQMARFLEFGAGPTAALLLDNAKWLGSQGLIDFLRYMLLQAYDFLHLFRERQCTLQVGGSDQWGNITAGVDLIRRIENAEAHGLVAPLVTMASGKKFGKTESGAIYLDPQLTSPYKFYQFWINVDDRDVESYLKLFTLKSKAEIAELMSRHHGMPAARNAQKALALDVTQRVHGQEADAAITASAILFADVEPDRVNPSALDALVDEIPTTTLPRGELSLVDAVVHAGLAKSKSEARRAIEQGGIYINLQRVSADQSIGDRDWIGGRSLLLRKGKKDYALLRREA